MFIHRVITVRVDTTHDFYYNAFGILQSPLYISLTDKAKESGKIINDNLIISSDLLTLERTVTWDSKDSFHTFFAEWCNHYPNYTEEMAAYNLEKGHISRLMLE